MERRYGLHCSALTHQLAFTSASVLVCMCVGVVCVNSENALSKVFYYYFRALPSSQKLPVLVFHYMLTAGQR